MNIPGFTAEASLCQTDKHYHAVIENAHDSESVYPAQLVVPINPYAKCWQHICRPDIGVNGGITWRCDVVYVC
jgi:hypothetical protein